MLWGWPSWPCSSVASPRDWQQMARPRLLSQLMTPDTGHYPRVMRLRGNREKIGPECSIAAELQILNCRRSFRRNFIVYHILISSKSRNLIFQTSWIIPHPLWNVKVKTSLCDHCFSSSAAWPDPELASGWPDSQHWTLAGLFSSGSKLSVSILNI